MGSPITTWEGAEAYFTYADSPGILVFSLLLAVIVTVGVVVSTMLHEKKVAHGLKMRDGAIV